MYLHLTTVCEQFLIMNNEDKTKQTAANRISYYLYCCTVLHSEDSPIIKNQQMH
jgi:hypothetical protein